MHGSRFARVERMPLGPIVSPLCSPTFPTTFRKKCRILPPARPSGPPFRARDLRIRLDFCFFETLEWQIFATTPEFLAELTFPRPNGGKIVERVFVTLYSRSGKKAVQKSRGNDRICIFHKCVIGKWRQNKKKINISGGGPEDFGRFWKPNHEWRAGRSPPETCGGSKFSKFSPPGLWGLEILSKSSPPDLWGLEILKILPARLGRAGHRRAGRPRPPPESTGPG